MIQYDTVPENHLFEKLYRKTSPDLIVRQLRMTEEVTSDEYILPALQDLMGKNAPIGIDSIESIGLILERDTLTDLSLFVERWVFKSINEASAIMDTLQNTNKVNEFALEGNFLWLYTGSNEIYLIHSYEYSFKRLAMKLTVDNMYKLLPKIISSCRMKRFEF